MNAELIKALRYYAMYICCDEPLLLAEAADALEAAEQRISELETQNELKDGTITAMATDIGKLQARMQTVTDCHTLEEGEQHGET